MGEDSIKKLVLDILARGRLQQQEVDGKIGVKDGGINMRIDFFVEQFENIMTDHTYDIASLIVGDYVPLKPTVDLRDGDRIPDKVGIAINQLKAKQKDMLELYKGGKL